MRRFAYLTGAIALAVAACDSEDGGDPSWADMDRDARLAFMNDTVLPEMRELFAAEDPVRWAEFRCESCHGPDMIAVDYAMPNFLSSLPLDDTIEVARAEAPQTTQFMLDAVFPTMVEFLGEEKFDPGTGQGYRCVGCHLVRQP